MARKASVKYHRKYVTAKTSFGLVRIEIYAEIQPGHLVKDEQINLIDNLTDHAMYALAGMPYAGLPINKIKVS